MNPVLFSSQTDLWETPADLFRELDEEFRFETDVCALPSNAKCARYFTPDQDGLKQEWTGVCWMNPPYGRQIGRWVEKAYESAQGGAVVVCLLPVRSCTTWFHRHVTRASEVRFLRGRVRFLGGEHPAPFPSAIVVFRPGVPGADRESSRWACYGPAARPARADRSSRETSSDTLGNARAEASHP